RVEREIAAYRAVDRESKARRDAMIYGAEMGYGPQAHRDDAEYHRQLFAFYKAASAHYMAIGDKDGAETYGQAAEAAARDAPWHARMAKALNGSRTRP